MGILNEKFSGSIFTMTFSIIIGRSLSQQSVVNTFKYPKQHIYKTGQTMETNNGHLFYLGKNLGIKL